MNYSETEQDIRDRLENWYRQRVGLVDAEVSNFKTPVSGVVNETYVHSVTFLQENERITNHAVLRVQPATQETPIPDVDVLKQAFVLTRLSKTEGLLTPRVLEVEPDREWLGRPFYVMERMRGVAAFDEGSVPKESEALRSMYEQAIEMMARIHSVDWHRTGLKSLYAGTGSKTSLQVQLDAYRQHLDEASVDKTYPLLEAAFDYLQNNLPAESQPVLNWGDARVGNLLYEGCELTAVLDWEIAEITAREVDIGWFTFFERFLRNDGVEDRPGAMDDDEIVALYERHSGVKLADLDYYQRWAAFRLAVMRLRAGLFDIKNGREPATSRIDEINFGSIEMARVFGFPEPGSL